MWDIHRQRMPVKQYVVGEGPSDSFQAQPAEDRGVFVHVRGVIE